MGKNDQVHILPLIYFLPILKVEFFELKLRAK